MKDCIQIATELGATAQSLWLADGTNYPGQDDLLVRRDRLEKARWPMCTPSLPAEQELLIEYKFFEPAFYATDLADWGSAILLATNCWGSGRRCSSTWVITPRG